MAKEKKKVIVYADWIKKFEALEDDEAGRLIKHFFRYINDLNPVAPDRIVKLSFIDIEAALKRDLKSWEQKAEMSRINGKSGGRPKETITQENPDKPKKTHQVILEPKKPVNDNVNDNDTVNVTVTDNVILKKEFYLNGESIDIPVSEYFKNSFPAFREQWVMKRGSAIELKVYEKMDSDYLGYSFSDLNHIQNTFKSVWKKVSEEKPGKTNPAQDTVSAYEQAKSKMGL